MKIQIINGPNINLLGKREPSIYGSVTFEDYLADLRKRYVDVEIDYFQSNIEGEMIDCIQQVGFDVDGIILNAGAYTHTSIALQDAIRSVTSPGSQWKRSWRRTASRWNTTGCVIPFMPTVFPTIAMRPLSYTISMTLS